MAHHTRVTSTAVALPKTIVIRTNGMSTCDSTLTQNRVKDILNYDPISGIFTWKVNVSSTGRAGNVAGSANKAGYLLIRVDKKLYLAHRLAALYREGEFPPALIDHLDMNKSNNSWANLRHATKAENSQNKMKAQSNNSKTGLLGVFWSEQQKMWGAKVNVNRRQHHAGFHSTPELAYEAYVNLKRAIHPFGTL